MEIHEVYKGMRVRCVRGDDEGVVGVVTGTHDSTYYNFQMHYDGRPATPVAAVHTVVDVDLDGVGGRGLYAWNLEPA